VQDVADMLESEPLLHRALAEADPGDVALSLMLYALSAIHEVMNLALQNRLKVLLHLAPRHLNYDC